jgi:hypothetical protein
VFGAAEARRYQRAKSFDLATQGVQLGSEPVGLARGLVSGGFVSLDTGGDRGCLDQTLQFEGKPIVSRRQKLDPSSQRSNLTWHQDFVYTTAIHSRGS